MKHYVESIPQNRAQCIEVLQNITTYNLFPETPNEIAKRMSLGELQEYTEETKRTISRNLSKKANNPKKNSKERTQLNSKVEYYLSMPTTTKESCLAILNYFRNSHLDKRYAFDMRLKSDSEIFAITRRIQKDYIKKVSAILKLEKTLNISNPHTEDELYNLSYNELTSIKNTLESKDIKSKKGTKVTKVEPAPEPLIEDAEEAINDDRTNYFDSSDISFITPMEAYQMFGSDFMDYTEEELFRLGYKLEEGPYPRIEPDIEPYRDALKKQIITYILGVTNRYTRPELKKKTLEQLRTIYETETAHLRGARTYDEIVHTIRLGS